MKIDTARKSPALGWAAAFAVVLIGAGWQLATRAGARSSLAPWDLALLRYTVPALVLAPVWWSCGLLPRNVPRWRLATMVCCAGLPFGLLAMAGASMAPAAHMGTLLPGASPLLVAACCWLVYSTSPGRLQAAGLVLLTAGLALITVPGWRDGATFWQGDLLFLSAALLWAVYTLALADCGLDAWQSTAVISAWSAIGAIALWCAALATGRSQLLHADASQIALQAVFQGVLAGVAGIAGFAVAVKHLGPSVTASLGALVPALVALGGWLLLNEPLSATGWSGVAAVAAGAWFASRRRAVRSPAGDQAQSVQTRNDQTRASASHHRAPKRPCRNATKA